MSKVGSGVKHIKAGDRVVYAQSALGAYSSVHNIIADKAAILLRQFLLSKLRHPS